MTDRSGHENVRIKRDFLKEEWGEILDDLSYN